MYKPKLMDSGIGRLAVVLGKTGSQLDSAVSIVKANMSHIPARVAVENLNVRCVRYIKCCK